MIVIGYMMMALGGFTFMLRAAEPAGVGALTVSQCEELIGPGLLTLFGILVVAIGHHSNKHHR